MSDRNKVDHNHIIKLVTGTGLDKLASPQAERAIIGTLADQPELYPHIADRLTPRDFSLQLPMTAYKVMGELNEEQATWNAVLLATEIETRYNHFLQSDYDSILTQLGECLAGSPQRNTVDEELKTLNQYVQTVIECAVRIRLVTAARHAERLANDNTRSLDSIIDESTVELLKATEQIETRKTDALSIADEYIAEMQELSELGLSMYVQSHTSALDEKEAFAYLGTVTIFAGATGKGKSTFLLGQLLDAARANPDELFILCSYEMSRHDVMRQWFAMLTGIYRSKMLSPKSLSKQDHIELMKKAHEELSNINLYVFDGDDLPLTTQQEALRKIRALQIKTGKRIREVVCDGLWLMSSNSGDTGSLAYDTIIREWRKNVAKSLRCAVILIHQFRAQVVTLSDSETPSFYHIDGQQMASRSTDIILALVRRKNNTSELYILKNRMSGYTGFVSRPYYNSQIARYEDDPRDEIEVEF